MSARLLVALWMLVWPCVPAQAQPQLRTVPAVQDPLVRMNEAVDALKRKVWPSVVHILVSSYAARDDQWPEALRTGDAADSMGKPADVGVVHV